MISLWQGWERKKLIGQIIILLHIKWIISSCWPIENITFTWLCPNITRVSHTFIRVFFFAGWKLGNFFFHFTLLSRARPSRQTWWSNENRERNKKKTCESMKVFGVSYFQLYSLPSVVEIGYLLCGLGVTSWYRSIETLSFRILIPFIENECNRRRGEEKGFGNEILCKILPIERSYVAKCKSRVELIFIVFKKNDKKMEFCCKICQKKTLHQKPHKCSLFFLLAKCDRAMTIDQFPTRNLHIKFTLFERFSICASLCSDLFLNQKKQIQLQTNWLE